MKYIVYKTTNLINGKIYVGVHRTDPSKFDGYIGCGVCREVKEDNKRGFPKAVHEYGYKNFKRETLFEYSDNEEGQMLAYKKEAEIVTWEFVKNPNTYNLVPGGEYAVAQRKVQIAQYSLDGKFIKVWDSIQSASEYYQLTSIAQNLIGVSKYCGDFQWKYYNDNTDDISPVQKKEKMVYQYDLLGNLIQKWDSIAEASKQFDNSISAKVMISRVCLGKATYACGYYWSFEETFKLRKNKHYAAVAKYDDDGKFLKSYPTIAQAAKQNNIPTTANIIATIKGSQKHCGGFRWRYFDGDVSNIEPLR